MLRNLMATFVVSLSVAGSGLAATSDDPEWPCIQRKITQMSLAQVWSGPLPDDTVIERAASPEVQALAQVLELRRTPMEQAEALIADFAQDADAQDLTALYLATFERLDRARSTVITGIGRYARRQSALDDQIDERRVEMSSLMAALEAGQPDHDRIDAVEEAIDWDTRIFIERQQSLVYVCETPVILEQRAFALGRAVMAHMPQ
jgi:hypothetical protein